MLQLWVYPACLAVAMAYASVGLGGGSAYLAILALSDAEHDAMRVAVLGMNLVVTGGGFILFARAGHFQPRLLVPFVVASIPAAFVGGILPLPVDLFRALLAVTLVLVAARMLWYKNAARPRRDLPWSVAWKVGPPIGAILGLVAGLVGIGGGVFLGPVLILLGWADAKRAGAVAAGFILLNSVSGLIAHAARGNFMPAWALPLFAFVLAGGLIGARAGAFRMPPQTLQKLFGLFILLVVVNLTWKLVA